MLMMKIGVVGLGYVGISLAVALGRYYEVIDFDSDTKKIDNSSRDNPTTEVSSEALRRADKIFFTTGSGKLGGFKISTISVPNLLWSN
jgi:UDP-N-acetyl-D-galactosamine dehydrogenase